MGNTELPTFRKPPVIETVLGVQFDPIQGFTNAHLGAFWKWLIADPNVSPNEQWTRVVDAPLIEPAFERFGDEHAWSPQHLMLKVANAPTSRLQIRNTSGDAMIQAQSTRLHYNWIRKADSNYSRYTKVRPEFDAMYQAFCEFLKKEDLPVPNKNQWEVTYVNHIPKGTVWNDPRDWASLFCGLPGPISATSDIRLESMNGAWHFEIPPHRGRVHVDLKHAKLAEDESKEILRLTLTARGPIDEAADVGYSLGEGLDCGRRAIVTMFKQMTSSDAHHVWELIQ